MSAAQRQRFIAQADEAGLAYGIGRCESSEVDAHNILEATFEAMRRALAELEAKLGRRATQVLVDGNADPKLGRPTETVIGGDAKRPAIGAASIVAKEHRDAWMTELAQRYPAYGFERHSGYPTKAHLAALAERGACPEHRLSFGPVRQAVVAGRHDRGREAEDAAARRLEAEGLQVVARNWSGLGGELDLVCDNGLELVVVEVRSRNDHVDPLETLVSSAKWGRIRRTTEELLYRMRLEDRFVRFDVVAVQGDQVAWLEDAWRPN